MYNHPLPQITPISSLQACGGDFSTSAGSITSPGYPGTYPDDLDCGYTITVPVGYVVTLTFTHIDVDYGVGCVADTVEVLSCC